MIKNTVYFIVCFCLFSLISCKSYKEEFKEFESASYEHVVKKTLEKYDAVDEKYSLLIFTDNYLNDKVFVKNHGDTLFNEKLITNEHYGMAKTIKINNNFGTKIVDYETNTIINIKKETAKKYKYIYVEKLKYYKDAWGNDSIVNKKPYTITYSNSLLGLM